MSTRPRSTTICASSTAEPRHSPTRWPGVADATPVGDRATATLQLDSLWLHGRRRTTEGRHRRHATAALGLLRPPRARRRRPLAILPGPTSGGVAQSVRAPACHAGGRGFVSRRSRRGRVLLGWCRVVTSPRQLRPLPARPPAPPLAKPDSDADAGHGGRVLILAGRHERHLSPSVPRPRESRRSRRRSFRRRQC